MIGSNPDAGAGHPDAALTPRPRRLLLIGRVVPGQETAVREAQARFPAEAAATAGVAAIEAFVGSGYYAVSLEIDADDVQETLAVYFNHPAVQAFHAGLQPVVEGLPGPGWSYGASDALHDDGAGGADDPSSGSVLGSADLPLAASMYRWCAGEPPRMGEEPRGRSRQARDAIR